jgi:hypothetical protein
MCGGLAWCVVLCSRYAGSWWQSGADQDDGGLDGTVMCSASISLIDFLTNFPPPLFRQPVLVFNPVRVIQP